MNLSLFKIFFGAALCVAPFALAANYAPALPLSGWATQNGGTTGGAKYGSVTVDNVSDLKNSDVDFVFKTESKSGESIRLYNSIKRLKIHHSIIKIGNNKPIYLQDKAFWELYDEIKNS